MNLREGKSRKYCARTFSFRKQPSESESESSEGEKEGEGDDSFDECSEGDQRDGTKHNTNAVGMTLTAEFLECQTFFIGHALLPLSVGRTPERRYHCKI